jgi:peptidyl-dipeptidase Dcp
MCPTESLVKIVHRFFSHSSYLMMVPLLFIAGCSSQQSPDTSAFVADEPANALLAEWSGPFGGIPAFDKMRIEDVMPAIQIAMAENMAELDQIASNKQAATFDNTIVAYQDSGRLLDRVQTYRRLLSSNLSTPEFRELNRQIAPMLAAHYTGITQNQALFNRIRTIYESDTFKSLKADQQRLVWLIYREFERDGATLEGESRQRYAEIRNQLADLYAQFSNNLLSDEEKYVLYLRRDQLDGLTQSIIQSASSIAESNGHPGKYAITNTRSSMDPFLTYSKHRDLREKVWRTYYDRGDNADAFDNNKVIQKILKLRQERVKLLGYDNYAVWQLEDRMAKTPDRVFELLLSLWDASTQRVAVEVKDMQLLADRENSGITIEPWDYRYYAEKVRQEKFDLDSETVSKYLYMENLLKAMFFVAREVFGLEFQELASGTVPVFHPSVRVWEVRNAATGGHVGLWYTDPFARPGKRSGAWATTYRKHESFRGKKHVLSSNNLNFIAAESGKPTLLSWDDAETLFHEFGHALNSLSSNVAYPKLNSGVRDYTEFHSQILERWLLTDKVINQFLVHYQTGEPMPDELVEKLQKSRTFNQGFATTEYLACALVDMFYHTADPNGLDPDKFERETLASLNMPREIVMRHRSTQFAHIFSGEGYAAGYYGYIWAEVLTSDAAEAFAEAPGGFYDQALASKLVKYQFAPHNSVDPQEAYRKFRGRDARVDALLRDRGFPVTSGRH